MSFCTKTEVQNVVFPNSCLRAQALRIGRIAAWPMSSLTSIKRVWWSSWTSFLSLAATCRNISLNVIGARRLWGSPDTHDFGFLTLNFNDCWTRSSSYCQVVSQANYLRSTWFTEIRNVSLGALVTISFTECS